MATSKKGPAVKKRAAPKKDPVQPTEATEVEESTDTPEAAEENTASEEPEAAEENTASEEPEAAEENTASEEPEATVKPVAAGQEYLTQVLAEYTENMRPGLGVSEDQGAREQVKLANILINNVYASDPDEFGKNMKTLLDWVKENRKGAFNERYAYRFVANMRLSAERRVLFEDLLTLTLTTSDHGAAGAGKQIDVSKLIARLADERMIENLQAYYKVS